MSVLEGVVGLVYHKIVEANDHPQLLERSLQLTLQTPVLMHLPLIDVEWTGNDVGYCRSHARICKTPEQGGRPFGASIMHTAV